MSKLYGLHTFLREVVFSRVCGVQGDDLQENEFLLKTARQTKVCDRHVLRRAAAVRLVVPV